MVMKIRSPRSQNEFIVQALANSGSVIFFNWNGHSKNVWLMALHTLGISFAAMNRVFSSYYYSLIFAGIKFEMMDQ